MENNVSPISNPIPVAPSFITYDDFLKVQLRVGKVIESAAHPNADKLCLVKVDIGGKVVQVVAGIRQFYAPETLVGKNVVVVINLAPRQLRGIESQGMILAATSGDSLKLVTIDGEALPGSVVK